MGRELQQNSERLGLESVYYIFMYKCSRVAQILGCENMTGQFLRERELPPLDPMVGSLE